MNTWTPTTFEGHPALTNGEHTILVYSDGTGTLYTENGPCYTGLVEACKSYSEYVS